MKYEINPQNDNQGRKRYKKDKSNTTRRSAVGSYIGEIDSKRTAKKEKIYSLENITNSIYYYAF